MKHTHAEHMPLSRRLNLSHKRLIGRYLRSERSSLNLELIRFEGESVSGIADPMPNTNKRGRIFLGGALELLREAVEWEARQSHQATEAGDKP